MTTVSQASHNQAETHPPRVSPSDHTILNLSRGSAEQLIQAVRAGLHVDDVKDFVVAMHISTHEFTYALGLPPRILSRYRKSTLVGEEAAKVLRYAKVLSIAIDTFGSTSRASVWLKTPNPTLLKMATPASLLDTEFGAEAVIETLTRIQHGVFY